MIEYGGSDYENHVQLVGCSVSAVGLYQQQRSRTAGEKHDRGRTSELWNDGRLPGRNQAAVQLSGAGQGCPRRLGRDRLERDLGFGRQLALETSNLPP
jgi:hypothetical protein